MKIILFFYKILSRNILADTMIILWVNYHLILFFRERQGACPVPKVSKRIVRDTQSCVRRIPEIIFLGQVSDRFQEVKKILQMNLHSPFCFDGVQRDKFSTNIYSYFQ
jgi:hypothetical protein